MDRSERIGLGLAAAGHVALFGLLSLGFVSEHTPPKIESKPIDVSLVDTVAVTAAAPAATEAPATSQAPDAGPPEDAAPPAEEAAPPEPAPPERAPPPKPAPAPPPKPAPAPPPKPAPVKPAPPKPAPVAPAPSKPAPPKPALPAPTKPTVKAAAKPARPALERPDVSPDKATGTEVAALKPRPRGSLLGDDFRKGLAISPEKGTGAAPRAAAVSAQAVAGLGDAIARQVQPCANRIPNPGPGANQIRSKLRIRMQPDGTLAVRPALMGQTGVDDENSRYAQRVAELATSAVIQCAPYKLPAELYEGGWKDIIINYRLPG